MGYIDPGAFGLISQIGYVLLITLASGFVFFFNPLKKLARRVFTRPTVHNAKDEAGDTSAQ